MQLFKFAVVAALAVSLEAQCPFGHDNNRIAKRSANWSPSYTNNLSSQDWDGIKSSIGELLKKGNGPVLVRLAWHDAGNADVNTKNGGPHATMRFAPVKDHGANNGLDIARNLLEPIKVKYPGITYADLWSFAGAVTIANSGGPKIAWRPGRNDAVDDQDSPTPDGRLPDATLGVAHLRQIFGRMGFDDRGIVALSGAHCLGRTNQANSGFSGPWTSTPTTFNNQFFVLLNNDFSSNYRQVNITTGNSTKTQFNNNDNLMMLPSDASLLSDPSTKAIVTEYANNSTKFFSDFKVSFEKLLELNVASFLSNSTVDTVIAGFSGTTSGNGTNTNGKSAGFSVRSSLASVALVAAGVIALF